MHAGDVCSLAFDANDPSVDLEAVEPDCSGGVGLVGKLDVRVALGQAGDAVTDDGDPVNRAAAAAGDRVGALTEKDLQLPRRDFEGDVGDVDGSLVDFSLVFRLVGSESERGLFWLCFGKDRDWWRDVVDAHGGVVGGEGRLCGRCCGSGVESECRGGGVCGWWRVCGVVDRGGEGVSRVRFEHVERVIRLEPVGAAG